MTEDGVQKRQHRTTMQDAVGVAVPCIGLEAELGPARKS